MPPLEKKKRGPIQRDLNLLVDSASKLSTPSQNQTNQEILSEENPTVNPVQILDDTRSFWERIALSAANTLKDSERKGGLETRYGQYGAYNQRAELLLQHMYLRLYEKHPWVRAAINRITKAVVNTQFNIIRKDESVVSGRTPDPAERAWLYDLFKVPNQEEPWTYFIGWLFSRLKVCGEAFLEVEKDGFGLPRNLWTLQGQILINVTPEGRYQEPLYKQVISAQQQPIDFNSDEVIHIKMPSAVGGFRGHSDMSALELTLLADTLASEFNKNIYTNSGSMTKLIKLAKGLSRDQAERNKQELREHFQRTRKAHSPAVIIEGDAEIQDLQETLKDVQFKEGRDANRTEILSVLGIPPHKVGIEEKFKSDVSAADQAFAREEIGPMLRVAEDAINHFLTTFYELKDYKISLNYEGISDPRRVARLVDVIARRGLGTLNETRRLLGWPDLPGGDVIRMWEPRLGVFIDPLNPPKAPIPVPIAMPTPPSSGGVDDEEVSSMQERLADLLESGEISKEELAEIISETIGDGSQEVADSDFFTTKELTKTREQYHTAIVSSISETEKRVLDKLPELFEEKLDRRLNPSRIDSMREVVVNGSIRVPSIRYVRGGYQAGQREINRQYGSNIDYRAVDKATFDRMKARANRVSRKLQKDMFAGEAKSGRLGVKKILEQSAAEGWSQSKTEKRLKGMFTQAKSYKATVIARSETGFAFRMGLIEGARKAKMQYGYIELGGLPCSDCASRASSIGVAPLNVLLGYMANHHPNNDCTITFVKNPKKEDINEDPDFEPPEDPWTASLNHVVEDSGFDTILLGEARDEVWLKVEDIRANLMYMTRYNYLKAGDFDNLVQALEKVPASTASRAVFELLNFIEFHDSLPDNQVARYVPKSRTFKLSRFRKSAWSEAWLELVGRLLYETLALDGRKVGLNPVLKGTWSPMEVTRMRQSMQRAGLNSPETFAQVFRIWFSDREYLLEKQSFEIVAVMDEYFEELRG